MATKSRRLDMDQTSTRGGKVHFSLLQLSCAKERDRKIVAKYKIHLQIIEENCTSIPVCKAAAKSELHFHDSSVSLYLCSVSLFARMVGRERNTTVLCFVLTTMHARSSLSARQWQVKKDA